MIDHQTFYLVPGYHYRRCLRWTAENSLLPGQHLHLSMNLNPRVGTENLHQLRHQNLQLVGFDHLAMIHCFLAADPGFVTAVVPLLLHPLMPSEWLSPI